MSKVAHIAELTAASLLVMPAHCRLVLHIKILIGVPCLEVAKGSGSIVQSVSYISSQCWTGDLFSVFLATAALFPLASLFSGAFSPLLILSVLGRVTLLR